MTPRDKIAIYYSRGADFGVLVAALRLRRPEALITAIVPRGYAPTVAEQAAVAEIWTTPHAHYSPRRPLATLRLLREIRSRHYDLLIVTFHTPQLRLFAASSGAARAEAWIASGSVVPIEIGIARSVASILRDALRGHVRAIRLLCRALFTRI